MHLSFFLLLALLVGLVLVDWRQKVQLLTLPAYRAANPLLVALVAQNGAMVALLWVPLLIACIVSVVALLAGLAMPSFTTFIMGVFNALCLYFVAENWRAAKA